MLYNKNVVYQFRLLIVHLCRSGCGTKPDTISNISQFKCFIVIMCHAERSEASSFCYVWDSSLALRMTTLNWQLVLIINHARIYTDRIS